MSHWKRILKVLGRPSSELYEMKYYKLWPIWPTVIILLCWFAAEVLSAYGTDFKFNYRNLTEINRNMIEREQDSTSLRLAGMINSYTVKIGKQSQKPFGVLMLEDLDSNCEIMLGVPSRKSLRA
mgnify:CR=1 FL=1